MSTFIEFLEEASEEVLRGLHHKLKEDMQAREHRIRDEERKLGLLRLENRVIVSYIERKASARALARSRLA